MLESAD